MAYMREIRTACRVSVEKPEGRRPPERTRKRLEHNIKVDLKEMLWVGVDLIGVSQDGARCWTPVTRVMNIRVS
jgi:hypothetical protein